MNIFKAVWLEADKEHLNSLIETLDDGYKPDVEVFEPLINDLIEMEVSCVLWTSEGGDVNLEIGIDQMIEPICSVLREYKIINEQEAKDIIEAEIGVITLY